MSMITMWFKKILLVTMVAALGLISVPLVNVYALGSSDTGTPTAPSQTITQTDRLQNVFAREQTIFGKVGKLFDNVDAHISKIQDLINKAKANGRDVSDVQAALDAFSAAVKQAQSTYQDAQSLISSHPGFDASGNVVDATTALQTVKDLGGKLKNIHQTVMPTAKALREAIKSFREANSPNVTPAPTNQSGG